MHQNKYWFFFLIFLSAITAWYSVDLGIKIYHYQSLSTESSAQVIEWRSTHASWGRYHAEAVYVFTWNETEYEGATILPDPLFRNEWSVKKYLESRKLGTTKVYFNPSSPQNSSLLRAFPWKDSVSTLLLMGLLIYFFWLGYYVSRLEK
ncbi:MAG: hypothetical protein CMO81_04675 [Waddliaceae bacterium]|nr:hypothetical protein [Waddliaceae bacterium]